MLFSLLPPLHSPILLPLRHFRCKCSGPDISFYRDAFARKMALAGIKPHHRIALGVSGGSDSMALCVLTAGWKSEGLSGKVDSSGYIDGLLGIVVDHRLRPESVEEARIVQERAMKMGIRCEISCCNWPDGRPKVGDLQEAAREMRYQNFQDVCAKKHIGVLLVAHHADDQIHQAKDLEVPKSNSYKHIIQDNVGIAHEGGLVGSADRMQRDGEGRFARLFIIPGPVQSRL